MDKPNIKLTGTYTVEHSLDDNPTWYAKIAWNGGRRPETVTEDRLRSICAALDKNGTDGYSTPPEIGEVYRQALKALEAEKDIQP